LSSELSDEDREALEFAKFAEDKEKLSEFFDKKWEEAKNATPPRVWIDVTEESQADDVEDFGFEREPTPEEWLAEAAKLPEDQQLLFLQKKRVAKLFDDKRAELRAWGEEWKEEQRQETEKDKAVLAAKMERFAADSSRKLDDDLVSTGLVTRQRLLQYRQKLAAEDQDAQQAQKTEETTTTTKKKEPYPWPPAKDAPVAVVDLAAQGGKPLVAGPLLIEELAKLGYANAQLLPAAAAAAGGLNAAALVGGTPATCAVVLADDKFSKATVTAIETVASTKLAEGGCLVLISRQGCTRVGNFDVAIRNARAGGAIARAAEAEDAAKLAVTRRDAALSLAVLRLGDVVDDVAAARQKKTLEVAVANAEVDPDVGPVSARVAAAALARVLVEPAARNATFSVAGTSYEDASLGDWSDEFLKLDGPELLRLDATKKTALPDVVSWLGAWANLFTDQRGTGLTTPVEVEKTPDGATLRFFDPKEKKKRQSRRQLRKPPQEGGVKLLAEPSPRSPTGAPRVRAVRLPYDPGLVVKAMSEDVILDKLKKDFTKKFS